MNSQELIEKYFLGKLTDKEQEAFNTFLKTDNTFKKEFRFQQNLQKIIETNEDVSFKKKLQHYENEFQPKKKSYTKWLAAASIALILATSYFLIFQNTTNETLFAENFEPYRNVIQPIVRGSVSKDIKTKAFVAYENGRYEDASKYFSEISVNKNEAYAIFYLANSNLALNKTSEAIKLLEEYISLNGDLIEKAHWYLALAYIKENNSQAAKKTFQKIINSKSYNHKKAIIILEELK